MTCVCMGLARRLQQWGTRRLVNQRDRNGERWSPATLRRGTSPRGPRVHQLQPTLFVDAIPELAAERRRRQVMDHHFAAEPADADGVLLLS